MDANRRVPMTFEEQFDRLIERWKSDAQLWPVERSEREDRLAAAEALMHQLQALVVPPAFAAHLEARLHSQARRLASSQGKVLAFPRSRAQSRRHQRTDPERQRSTVSSHVTWPPSIVLFPRAWHGDPTCGLEEERGGSTRRRKDLLLRKEAQLPGLFGQGERLAGVPPPYERVSFPSSTRKGEIAEKPAKGDGQNYEHGTLDQPDAGPSGRDADRSGT
jgi:hypothetical protein